MPDRVQDLTNHRKVAVACKNYTDDKIEEALELLEDYDLSSDTISQTSTSATAPSDVRTASLIQVGGNSVKYAPSTASDDSVSKIKSIPLSTFTLGVDYVGGYTEKSLNDFTTYFTSISDDTGVSHTQSGNSITITNSSSSNSRIVINNTLNGTHTFAFDSDTAIPYGFRINSLSIQENIVVGTNVYNNIAFAGNNAISIYIPANTTITISNIVSSTNYFTGLRSAKVSEIKVSGANILNIPNITETTTYGITYSVNNGTIALKGTANNYTQIFIPLITSISSGTFSYNQFNKVSNYGVYLTDDTSQTNIKNILTVGSTTSSATNIETSFVANYLYIYVPINSTVNEHIFTPMLVLGTTAPTTFIPYIQPITKQIPSEIQALDGYGYGINSSVYNYIDFDNKKFIQKVGRVDLGSLNYTYDDTVYNRFYVGLNTLGAKSVALNTDVANILCSIYETKAVQYIFDNLTIDKLIGISNNSTLTIRNLAYTDIQSFKTAMSGIYLYYELATPIETDISSYLDDSFKTFTTNDQYTDIEMVNPYNYDMPNKISYFGTIKDTLVEDITITNVGEQPQTIDLLDSDVSDGWSASASLFNYRDVRERKRHKVVGRVDLGNLTWQYNSANNVFYASISNKTVYSNANQNILCTNYSNANTTLANMPDKTILETFIGNSRDVAIKDTLYNGDTTTFKTAMSGVYLYYELATEVIEDLDIPYDLHYLPLTSGGTVVFNNDNNQQCHNTIRYSIMEAKE